MSIELHWLLLGLSRVFLTQCSVWEWEWARGPLSSAASHWLTAGSCTLPRAARPAVKWGGSVHHGAALTTGACQQRARYRPARRHRLSATLSKSVTCLTVSPSPDCVIIIQLNINTQHKQPRKSRPQFSAAKHIERRILYSLHYQVWVEWDVLALHHWYTISPGDRPDTPLDTDVMKQFTLAQDREFIHGENILARTSLY